MYLYCIYIYCNQPTTFAIHKDIDGQKTSSYEYIQYHHAALLEQNTKSTGAFKKMKQSSKRESAHLL